MKAEIQEPAQLGLCGDPLPGLQVASFMSRGEEELPSVFYKGPHPHDLIQDSHLPNQPPTGFTSILCDTVFLICIITGFGHILFANLLTRTNLVLCQLQVTSSICDLTIQYFIVQKINLFLIFMLTCCIFIFIQEIFLFFFFF